MSERSHTSESPDALTPTNHVYLLCKHTGPLEPAASLCVWAGQHLAPYGLLLVSAKGSWTFPLPFGYLYPLVALPPLSPSPFQLQAWLQLQGRGPPVSPATLDFGVSDKRSVRKCKFLQ